MGQSRAPLLAGVVVLLLVGLLIAWFVLQQPAPANSRAKAANAPAGNAAIALRPDAPRPQTPDSGGPETGPENPQPQPKVVVPRLRAAARVSGRALDFYGDGAPGITVTLLPEDEPVTTGPSAVPDDNGNFSFEEQLNVGDRYFVACLMERKALAATAPFLVEKDKPVEGLTLTVLDAARAFGVVINGASNEPLPGVKIETSARAGGTLARLGALLGRLRPCVSDEAGRFALEHLAPGTHLFTAHKPGWTANEINPLTRDRQEVELAEFASFELLPFVLVQAGIIEGRVLRKADNTPIGGAVVELGTILGGMFELQVTDAQGRFRFENAPPGIGGNAQGQGPGQDMGGLTLRATAPGYAIGTRNVRVSSGQTRSGQDILLDSGCVVNGRVVNDRGEPVAGAAVYYNDTDFQRGGELVVGITIPPRKVATTSAEDGSFTLAAIPPGTVTLAAARQGYANATATVQAVVGTPQTVTLVLAPQAVIYGTVTDDRGEPVAGVAVAAYEADGPRELGFVMKSFFGESLPDRGESTMFPTSIRSGTDGSYRIEGLKAARYVVVATGPLHEKHVSEPLALKVGTETRHDIKLAAGGIIYGRVYDAAGLPMPGVPVTGARLIADDSVRVKTAYTDRNGNYELTGLGGGVYRVVRNTGDLTRLLLPNPASEVEVQPGQRVQFDLYDQKPGTARIYGRVRLDGEVYAEKSLVLIGGSFGGFAANNTTTDPDGRYEFRSVPLGTYQIARGGQRGPSLVRQRVRVDKAGDIEVNIDFFTVSISGRIELEGGGVPEGRVRVMASPVSAEGDDAGNDNEQVNSLEMLVVEETNAGEKGEFTIRGLSPGFYRLTVRSEKNGMATRPYLNARASVSGLVIQLPRAAATLSGVVRGLDDAKPNTPFGLIAALTIEDERGRPISLGGFDNAVNLTQSKEFTVPGLAEGTFTVTLSAGGYTPVTHKGVKFTAGQTTALVFAFAASGNARVTLTNSDIVLASAYELQYDIVNSKGETFVKRFTFLDFFNPDGSAQNLDQNSFVVRDMPPETYTITLKLPGYKEARQTFVVIAGQTTDVAVTFEKQ
ncbi:MAG: carboxypeptidase regulatory-like domain-containing protein [Planctomycetes bacterium]|nr:carboxypeptidase regulatory-like domain-containing protein [Planctomycetota bacterium]